MGQSSCRILVLCSKCCALISTGTRKRSATGRLLWTPLLSVFPEVCMIFFHVGFWVKIEAYGFRYSHPICAGTMERGHVPLLLAAFRSYGNRKWVLIPDTGVDWPGINDSQSWTTRSASSMRNLLPLSAHRNGLRNIHTGRVLLMTTRRDGWRFKYLGAFSVNCKIRTKMHGWHYGLQIT